MSVNAQNVSYNYARVYAKSDTVGIPDGPSGQKCCAIYNGGAGNIVAIMQNDETVLFTAVPIGVLEITCKRINATNTTAGPFVALYQN